MYIVLLSAVIVNILSVILLPIGLIYNFDQPKYKAVYGYLIAGCMLLYILMLGMALIYGLFVRHYLFSLVLFLCIISHFIIGKLVTYETLKKYTIAQVMCYIVSLITLLLNF